MKFCVDVDKKTISIYNFPKYIKTIVKKIIEIKYPEAIVMSDEENLITIDFSNSKLSIKELLSNLIK